MLYCSVAVSCHHSYCVRDEAPNAKAEDVNPDCTPQGAVIDEYLNNGGMMISRGKTEKLEKNL
jgi:hypothetical protein